MIRPKLILLDAGHGGIIEGQYQTPGKRDYLEGSLLAEGMLNRAVTSCIAYYLHLWNIPAHTISDQAKDTSLKTRVRRANDYATDYDCFLLSIHHNAAESRNAYGYELFTSRGETQADPIAEYIGGQFLECFPGRRLRLRTQTPDILGKEADFTILKKTTCPAVLSEWGFMTNDRGPQYDRDELTTGTGIYQQAFFYAYVLKNIYNEFL